MRFNKLLSAAAAVGVAGALALGGAATAHAATTTQSDRVIGPLASKTSATVNSWSSWTAPMSVGSRIATKTTSTNAAPTDGDIYTLPAVGSPAGSISPASNPSLCITAHTGASWQYSTMETCVNSAAQKFTVQAGGRIISSLDGRVLQDSKDGAAIEMATVESSAATDDFFDLWQLKAVHTDVAISGPAEASTVTTKRPTVTGTGEPDATITVTTQSGKNLGTTTVKADGTWTLTPTSDIVTNKPTLTATQNADGNISTATVTFTIKVAATLTAEVTIPTDVTRQAMIGGAGENGGTVTVTLGGTTIATTTVVGGKWSVEVPTSVGVGVHTFTATQTVGGKTAGMVNVSHDFGSAVTASSTIAGSTATITGSGVNGDRVVVTENGAQVGTATVANGTYSIPVSNVGIGSHTYTVTQTAPGNIVTAATTTAIRASAITVTNPANPAAGYTPNTAFTFSGTAPKNAGTLTIRNFTGVLVATVPVDPSTGEWSWTRANMGTSTWKLTFITGEGTANEEKFTLPDFAPNAKPVLDLQVLNPANPAAGYTPNTAFTFSGVAKKTAGTLTIRNFTGVLVATVPVDPTTGAWSWTRPNLGTSTWKLTFITNEGTSAEQKVTLGDFAPRS